jgi:peptide deformylase
VAVRPILYYPDKRLFLKAEPVKKFNSEIVQLCNDLADTMNLYGGVGIAAPQIGVSLQVFLISHLVDKNIKGDVRTFINPKIVWSSEELSKDLEGCLSFPDIFAKVERPSRISLKALDRKGEGFELVAEGFLARAIQHEQDHLSGELFINLVSNLKRGMMRKKLVRWKRKHGVD